jgi:maltooligosyltrehalose trehalohydrolase
MTALLLLMPGTPMLFQGQEFAASTPFFYFADFEPELAAAVRHGRSEFMSQFPSAVAYERSMGLPNPSDPETFRRSKLDLAEREAHASIYALHKDLIRLRKDHAAFSSERPRGVDGAVLSSTAFVLRFPAFGAADDRLLLVNLGPELNRRSFAEPLIAPPADTDWQVVWSSDDPRYGGYGSRELWVGGRWSIPAEAALLLAPGPRRQWTGPRQRRRTA